MSIQEAIPTVFQEPISFPRDQTIYQGLSTKLLNWSALETDIANRPAFSGVLEILGPEETIHLFFYDSKRVAVRFQKQPNSRFRGIEEVESIQGLVSLYVVNPVLVKIVAQLEKSIIREVSAALSALGLMAFIEQMNQASLTGLLRLAQPQKTGQVEIFFDNGRLIWAKSSVENVAVNNSNDLQSLASLFDSVELFAALYQTSNLEQPVALPEPGQSTFADSKTILKAWNEVLSRLQAVSDKMTVGLFAKAWSESGIALADTYPLLDPFLADLVWQDNQLQLQGDAPDDFAESLAAGLIQTMSRLGLSPEVILPAIGLDDLQRRHRRVGFEFLTDKGGR